MKKFVSGIATLLEIIIIIALIALTIFAIYFFLYRGYNIEQIKDISEININFISDTITEIKQIGLGEETTSIDIEQVTSYNEKNNNLYNIEIPTSGKEFYYNQLDDTGKGIYTVLKANKDNLKTGTYEITLPDSITNVLYQNDGEEIMSNAFQAAWDAFIYDYTDTYYLDTSKITLLTTTTTFGSKKTFKVTLGKGDNKNYFIDGFASLSDVNNGIDVIENARMQIINQVQGLSDYEKIKYVHDWLIDNIEYDVNFENTNSHNIYGTFIDREVVCEGYAKGFKYIMDGLDIPCILVKGIGENSSGDTEKHMWNYVNLDGDWYAIIEGNGRLTKDLKYKYFLKGRTNFTENHREEGQISIGGKEFSYPKLSISDYE